MLSVANSRDVIISSAVVVWSAFTAFGGLAKNCGTFWFSRIGVALGEAALTPAAHSLISNYVPQAARAKGLALYSFGFAVGSFAAPALGGYSSDRFGWQTAFFLIGGSGVVISFLVMLTVRAHTREAAPLDLSLTQVNTTRLFGNPVL